MEIGKLVWWMLTGWWSWRNQSQPYLECREDRRFSLVDVSEHARKRIIIEFDGHSVESLYVTKLTIRNLSAECIEKGQVIVVAADSIVLDASAKAPGEADCQVNQNEVTLTFDYLNPIKNSEMIELILITSGDAPVLAINGRGKGWTTKHLRHSDRITRNAWIGIAGGVLVAVALCMQWSEIPLEPMTFKKISGGFLGLIGVICVM